MAEYLYGLFNMPLDEAQRSMEVYFKQNEKDTAVVNLVKKYLYDPNSPYRNEDLYLPFVKGLAESEYTPEEQRAAYRRDVKMCSMNQFGQTAPDFVFCTLQGKKMTLHSVPGEYTMLFFSNPGCTACKEIIDQVMSIEPIVYAIQEKRLSVVNVYIDKDLKAWREYAVNYPESWYSGYDPKYILREDVLYNVRAIPSLYLLDSEKKVLMKDAPTERVLMFLVNSLQ